MAEPIEDDRIASLFNEFRAEAGTEILPPGTQAAQQTVRRRRTTRLIGIAALAVGLAGVVLGIANVSGGAPVEPADSHSYGPTLEPAERERLAVEALGTFRYKPPHTARPDLLPIRPGVIFGGLDEHSAGTTYGIGTADEPIPPGEYHLGALCFGQGEVTVGWSAPEMARGSVAVSCVRPDGEFETTAGQFTVPVPSILNITVTPDEEASGRAGVAVVVTDPRIVLARNALGELGAGELRPSALSGEQVLATNMMIVDESGSAVGDYRLSIACVGAGSIEVTFTIGVASASDSLACTQAGAQTSVMLGSPTAGATMSVVVEPDVAAAGQAAIAYRVTKL